MNETVSLQASSEPEPQMAFFFDQSLDEAQRHQMLEQVLQEHGQFIERTAYKFTYGSMDDALDVSQAVALKLCRQLPTLTRASMRTWLFTVTRNAARDHYRRQHTFDKVRARAALLHVDVVEDPDDRLMQRDAIDRVREASSRLSPTHRHAISDLLQGSRVLSSKDKSRRTRAVAALRNELVAQHSSS